MTKEKNGKMLRWAIGTGLVLLAAYAGLVGTWTVYGKDIAQTAEEVSELATGGCVPAQRHNTDIALIQQDIEHIKKAQDRGFEAILNKLDKLENKWMNNRYGLNSAKHRTVSKP